MRRRFVLAAILTVFHANLAGVDVRAEEKPAAAEKTAAEKAAPVKPDAERIIGTWVFDSSDRKNELFTGDGQTMQISFVDDKFEFAVLQSGGKVLQIGGTYFLDDKQTPKLFDVNLLGDGGANSVFAIYEFKDDKFRVRVRDNNGPRPVDFETPADDCQILVFRRDDSGK